MIEQGRTPAIRWRTRIVWRWPTLQVVYTKFPTFEPIAPRPVQEQASAATRQDWGSVNGI